MLQSGHHKQQWQNVPSRAFIHSCSNAPVRPRCMLLPLNFFPHGQQLSQPCRVRWRVHPTLGLDHMSHPSLKKWISLEECNRGSNYSWCCTSTATCLERHTSNRNPLPSTIDIRNTDREQKRPSRQPMLFGVITNIMAFYNVSRPLFDH